MIRPIERVIAHPSERKQAYAEQAQRDTVRAVSAVRFDKRLTPLLVREIAFDRGNRSN